MKNFKKAFAWMQRVQEACLFTPNISVDIELQFTPGNHKEDTIDGFSCKLFVLDHNAVDEKSVSAGYFPWWGYENFSKEAAKVEDFLAGIGIQISKASNFTKSELDDLREAVLGRIEDLADARDMTNGLNMPEAASLYEKEIKKYNEILAKLQ